MSDVANSVAIILMQLNINLLSEVTLMTVIRCFTDIQSFLDIVFPNKLRCYLADVKVNIYVI